MDKTNSTLDITEIQVAAAKLANQSFFWRVTTDAGKTIDQFDPLTGVEQQFPNWVEWVHKSPSDPFSGQPSFRGVSIAYWIPVIPGADAFFIERDTDTHSIVIFRKRYTRSIGSTYTVYCIGKRWEGDSIREEVYHICPPARYHKESDSMSDLLAGDQGIYFPGGVSLVKSPLDANEFDKFLSRATSTHG